MPEAPDRKIVSTVEDASRRRARLDKRRGRRAAAPPWSPIPIAGRYVEDPADDGSAQAARPRLPRARLVEALGASGAASRGYGKAALIGWPASSSTARSGTCRRAAHGMRDRLAGAHAIVPSTEQVGAAGSPIDVPIHHLVAAYVRSHFDTIEVRVPRRRGPTRCLLVIAMTGGPRRTPASAACRRRDQAGRRPAMSDPLAAAMAALDDYMAGLNRGDEAAVNAACNFPHVRLAGGKVTVWPNHGDYKLDDFVARAGDGWARSQWDERQPDPCRAGQGPPQGGVQPLAGGRLAARRFETIYIVTLQAGHWGIQARSSAS